MMADRKTHGADMTHSLDRLSDRERDLLTLLAQGHTAKTIAITRALSVNVVNEHLRSARRKTDAPSSRELARIVAGQGETRAQESRDNLLGVERPTDTAHPGPPRRVADGVTTARAIRRPMMILAALLAVGVLAYQTSVPDQPGQTGASDVRNAPAPAPAPAPAESVRPDVIYQVYFKSGEAFLGSPTVAGQFGREVRVEIPNLMRVIMVTGEPDRDGRSDTSVKMSIFRDDAWQPVQEMSMKADLTSTPSFEHTVEGTPYRFVVMPRLIVPAAS
jgi:DNA-binding CsgD family transcriptional regulator